MCFNLGLGKEGHAQCLSWVRHVAGRKGKTGGVFTLHSAELQIYIWARVPVLTALLLLPLYTCNSYHTNVHGYVYSLFSSWPQLCKKICVPKEKKVFLSSAFHKDEVLWCELGSWFWTTPHLDPGHSVFSFLTCMAPWLLAPSPVTSCKKMPGCTLGASAASSGMWCTSSLTKKSISL